MTSLSTPGALRVSGVSMRYGDTPALADLTFELKRGEVLSIVGPNGAGKTTLSEIVVGLRRADTGCIDIDGEQCEGPRPPGIVGYAAQEIAIYPTLTLRNNLQFFAQLAGIGRRDVDAECKRVAEIMMIVDLMDNKAGAVSGGEARRLHNAISLIGSPSYLILDEPTAGVDVHGRFALLDQLRSLAASGSAILYTTHYLPEVEYLDSEVLLLHNGRELARGQAADLVKRFGTRVVAVTLAAGAEAVTGDETIEIEIGPNDDGIEIARHQLGIRFTRASSIVVREPTLDTVFKSLVDSERSKA